MNPWEFNKMLRGIKDLPDHFLLRLLKAATHELGKRNRQKLKTLRDEKRNRQRETRNTPKIL